MNTFSARETAAACSHTSVLHGLNLIFLFLGGGALDHQETIVVEPWFLVVINHLPKFGHRNIKRQFIFTFEAYPSCRE